MDEIFRNQNTNYGHRYILSHLTPSGIQERKKTTASHTWLSNFRQTVSKLPLLYFQLNVRTFDVKRSPNISSPTNKTSLLRNNTITIPQSLKRVKDLAYNIFLFSAIVGNTSEKTIFDRVVLNAWTDRKYGNSSSFKCCLRFKSRRLVQKALITRINWAYMWSTKVQAKQYVCPNPRGRYGDTVVGVTIAYNRTKCPIAPIWYVKPSYAYRHENEIAICAKVSRNH